MNRDNDSRYPYTYACDYIREKVGDDYGKGLISRAAASQTMHVIAESIGIEVEDVAKSLASMFLEENGL